MDNVVVERHKSVRHNCTTQKSFQDKAARTIAEFIIKSYFTFRIIRRSSKKGWSVVKTDMKELNRQLILMVKNNRRRIAKISVLTATSVVIGCFTILFLIGITGIYQKYNFTKANWSSNPSSRLDMMDSFMSQYDVSSMSQIEVENLLGDPAVIMTKDECEYKVLKDCDYDEVVEYQLNDGSKSLFDIIEKHYAIAYKDGEVAWSDIIVSDSMHKEIDDKIMSAKAN